MRPIYGPDPYEIYQWQEDWKDFAWDIDLENGESDHWEWFSKALQVGQDVESLLVALADDVDDRCHGLMKLVWPKDSRLAPGRPSLYVDYLEIAPWNRKDYPRRREYTGLGLAMMRHAAQISDELGFAGRLTLCSLPQAEAFYRKIPMSELGVGEGHDDHLAFFELDAATAMEFIKEFEIRSIR